ncbi:MAG: YaaA family protein [Rickettsia sp.]|nr:YaaA family protein [Rickettsia sp.]
MIFIISSAKTLNLNLESDTAKYSSYSYFLEKFHYIRKYLSILNLEEIKNSMNLSYKLAELNFNRFQNFHKASEFPAMFLYQGDVYKNLNPSSLNDSEIDFLQQRLRIISALYGMVKPLDKILQYRLEMSTKFNDKNFVKLDQYWSSKVTSQINLELGSHKEKYLINLASQEYSKVIDTKLLKYPMVNIEFRQKIGDKVKNIGLYAKKARGLMLRYFAKEKVDKLEKIKNFSTLGFLFDPESSNGYNFYFVKNID